MKKLFTCIAVLFALSSTVFAEDSFINISFIKPFCKSEKYIDSQLNSWGVGVEMKTMNNEVWGYEFGGNIAFHNNETTGKFAYLSVDAIFGLPIRIFDTDTINIFVTPLVGVDLSSTDSNDSEVLTVLFAGGSAQLDFKFSDFLYLNAGIEVQYHFFRMYKDYSSTVDKLMFLPKVGITLVM